MTHPCHVRLFLSILSSSNTIKNSEAPFDSCLSLRLLRRLSDEAVLAADDLFDSLDREDLVMISTQRLEYLRPNSPDAVAARPYDFRR